MIAACSKHRAGQTFAARLAGAQDQRLFVVRNVAERVTASRVLPTTPDASRIQRFLCQRARSGEREQRQQPEARHRFSILRQLDAAGTVGDRQASVALQDQPDVVEVSGA